MGDAYGYGEHAQIANPKGMKRMSTGSIFYKTKLCSKFRAGNCPYINNCNFAHGMEELRKPPPGWEEFVNPPLVPDNGPSQKSKPCKKFFNEGSCPYGDRCIFSHEDLTTPVVQAPVAGSSPSVNNAKPSNWKTRLCNKWETTGYCPFGEKCHFAHGLAELHKYTGVEPPSVNIQMDTKKPPLIKLSDSSQSALDSRIFTPPQQQHIPVTASKPVPVPPSSKPAQVPVKSANITLSISKPVAAPAPVWKGPTEGISTIYGDWLEDNDDDEWEEQRPDQELFVTA